MRPNCYIRPLGAVRQLRSMMALVLLPFLSLDAFDETTIYRHRFDRYTIIKARGFINKTNLPNQ